MKPDKYIGAYGHFGAQETHKLLFVVPRGFSPKRLLLSDGDWTVCAIDCEISERTDAQTVTIEVKNFCNWSQTLVALLQVEFFREPEIVGAKKGG